MDILSGDKNVFIRGTQQQLESVHRFRTRICSFQFTPDGINYAFDTFEAKK